MKKSMFFALATLGLVAMASCEKEAEKVKEPAPELTNETQITGIPFTGGEFTYEFDSNKKWTVAGDAEVTIEGQTYEFGLNPTSGDAGHGVVTVTVPANKGAKEISYSFTLTLLGEDKDTEPLTKTVSLTIPAPSVTDAAGNTYKVVYLKDGNYWMAENLRYVPEGKTVSDDPTKGEIWYPYDFASLKAVKDEERIKTNGLFYTLETTLGTNLTLENIGKQEKVQGICPKGWHIPSFEEAYILFGGANSLPESCKLDKPYTEAYYYYADYKGGNVKKFNEVEPEANLKFVGSVTIAGTKIAYQKTITGFENFPMTNFWTSTLYKAEKATVEEKEELDKIKSQNFAISLMAAKNNPDGKINLGYVKIKSGSSVRCVMDKTAK